jgi:hypothetical protein
MSIHSNLVFPGNRDIRLIQAAYAIIPAYSAIVRDDEGLLEATVSSVVYSAIIAWIFALTAPLSLPGGEETRRVQAATVIVTVVLTMDDYDDPVRGLAEGIGTGLVVSIVVGNIAFWGSQGVRLKNQVQDIAGGNALADAIRSRT